VLLADGLVLNSSVTLKCGAYPGVAGNCARRVRDGCPVLTAARCMVISGARA
jgi:hypothetical protein